MTDHDSQPVPDITSFHSLNLDSETIAIRLDISSSLQWADTAKRQLSLWQKIMEICGENKTKVEIIGYDGLDAEVSFNIPLTPEQLAEERENIKNIKLAQIMNLLARWETFKHDYEILKREFGE